MERGGETRIYQIAYSNHFSLRSLLFFANNEIDFIDLFKNYVPYCIFSKLISVIETLTFFFLFFYYRDGLKLETEILDGKPRLIVAPCGMITRIYKISSY